MVSKLVKYGSSTFFMVHNLAKVVMADGGIECYRQTCRPIEEYCAQFEQACMSCSSTCDPEDIKYEEKVCNQHCSDFIKLEPLKNEIHYIQMQQNVILILLIVLLIITAGHFTWKLMKCFKNKRCSISRLMGKLKLKKQSTVTTTHMNGKDLGGITIPNMSAINDVERAPSQIYSLAGSVRTVTTPISSRHPAENTTPSPQPNEYSYDNQGLVVTPISEKPSGRPMF
ncbi:protein grindelwald isoform X2 [Calliphora vicina]|uniref:protein grindelwald isoform X2 n=1 Tax=Calliphora vicina TaxID=7373 RepID=UPI00325AA547